MDDWEHKLAAVIDDFRAKPFCYGRADCLVFADAIARDVHGVDFAGDWRGAYCHKDGRLYAKRTLVRKFGFKGLREAISSKFAEVSPQFVQRGMLVAANAPKGSPFDVALGVCTGSAGVFLAEGGLTAINMDQVICGWDVSCRS